MSNIQRGIIAAVFAAMIIGVIFFIVAGRHMSPSATAPSAVPTSSPAQATKAGYAPSYIMVQPGEAGVLDTGSGTTDVATSPQALIGLGQAAQKRNLAKFRRYFSTGQAVEVPDGTPVKLLIGGMQVNEVQFTDGAYLGHTGWIATEWIRRADQMPRKDRGL